MKNIKVKDVIPDKNQPRKEFISSRLSDLKDSIKKHGIINPLVVEEYNGKYLIVDGERRFRAAEILKMKEVPANIRKPQNSIDRLIQQFQLQEQHEGWSAVEKAMAIERLTKELSASLEEVCQLLNLPRRTIRTYIHFSQLMNKDTFVKSEIALNWVVGITDLNRFFKRFYLQEKGEDFPKKNQKLLEKSLVEKIKRGVISNRSDIAKIKDSLRKNPKMVDKFLNDAEMTVDSLFLKSDARSAYHYRNLMHNLRYSVDHIRRGSELGFEELFSETDIRALKTTHETLGKMIKRLD